jgi:hypothetical protein
MSGSAAEIGLAQRPLMSRLARSAVADQLADDCRTSVDVGRPPTRPVCELTSCGSRGEAKLAGLAIGELLDFSLWRLGYRMASATLTMVSMTTSAPAADSESVLPGLFA